MAKQISNILNSLFMENQNTFFLITILSQDMHILHIIRMDAAPGSERSGNCLTVTL